MSQPPIPLHTHSYYSLLSGVAAPAELARAAAEAGMSAVALTDQHRLTGAVEFVEACQAAGVRPLLGLTLEVEVAAGQAYPLVFLAHNLHGWAQLCQLSTAATSTETLTVNVQQIAEHASDLLCLSGGGRSWLNHLVQHNTKAAAQWLAQLHELFADRLYVELQTHTQEERVLNTALAQLAQAQNIPLVATHSVFYLRAAQAETQRTLSAIRLIRPRATLTPAEVAPVDAHWLTPTEWAARFAAWPQALANTHEIAARCTLTLPLGQPHYPAIELPPGVTALAVLREKAYAGAGEQYQLIDATVRARLEHELNIIGERGYAPLFLILEDILRFARQSGVPLSSRGSAASSLVAHCLGLTSPDPLRLDLYFERFLNPARATPPDIDTDLCSRRREQVIRYVFEKYGRDRVAMVATINRFRSRSGLRETAKAFGLPPKLISELVEALPERWYGPHSVGHTNDPFAELRAAHPQHSAIFEHAAALRGLPRHLSIHPGGIVITPGPLTERIATQPAANGVTIAQFDLEAIERFGLIKLDLLGIRGLSVLGDVAVSVARDADTEPLSVLNAVPEDDAAVREMLRTGRTIGCFQVESPGMRGILREIQATTVDDLMVALALYRPGPLTGGLKDSFVRRHLGQEPVRHLHPALAPLLAETHGVILYQEQVLRIAHGLAGLSLAEADLLRRAMSHFDPGKQMQTLQEKFVAGAQAHSGVPPEIGARVWELMAAFAGYGFPKAHAASYAQIAWKAAWCKAHFPAEFMAAVLANWGGFYSQRVYLTEARRLGLPLHGPHLNHSQTEFTVVRQADGPHLYMGLNQVKDLTQRTQRAILRARPFHSLADFLTRVDPRPAEAESLIQVGALAGFGPIPTLLRQLRTQTWQAGQMALFGAPPSTEPEWSLAEQVAAQELLLGASVAAHPLELVAEASALAGAVTTLNALTHVGQRVRVAGMRQSWVRSATTRGGFIYFMALEDLEGMLDVVLFDDAYRRSKAALKDSVGPFLVEGLLELDPQRGEPTLRAERIERLSG